MNEDIKEILERLKGYMTAHYMGIASHTSGGCSTCGYGGDEYASLEDIRGAIDSFAKLQYHINLEGDKDEDE